ncbi:acetyltransferase, ribosomal protein N-acetylase [Hoeflea sp. IMCC20628]|uniref:GNAT family N-acetyltransferase n=1 Tax=Hoeflea sp. IMCC20628 TaxID=1620421 RepID=UPI00063AF18B|nr:GNAT family protein [Hoeflea sp. IMCC20628]AKH99031.1 acetyltransferase, ribosomal protein N-acetylase [Hoeflea sp. IMCC20628]
MHDLTNWQPRPAPEGFSVTGRYVMIEPYDRDVHETALWDALGGTGVNDLIRYFPNGPFDTAGQLADFLSGTVKAGVVVNIFRSRRTGDIVGMASLMRPDPANGVVEVGAVAHGAAMARTPMSTEAHYLMARHVFEDLDYRRYEWKCHNENAASKITAIRLGFQFEGVFRQHIVSKGGNRDTAWFSMIDGEWPDLKAAFEAWLDPSNFDADSRQKRRLEDIRQAGR